jgi:hypothetical protein
MLTYLTYADVYVRVLTYAVVTDTLQLAAAGRRQRRWRRQQQQQQQAARCETVRSCPQVYVRLTYADVC